ncbi:MAG: hypothetical protein E6726_08280 [Clostridium sp.]|nr:hypothetical protein [Clostridium sp.]MDU1978390.1 hypothetical protein [Clostridium sp.]MDU1994812.1 hypothetical protein [Clostridium sp.]MDU6048471.1 hypothetical protein [Clostridium sp.]MDU6272575.1 hypothetical protein [Clostridium sp.]MDU6328635.1 hypothetical protein [Clostridium sp.]
MTCTYGDDFDYCIYRYLVGDKDIECLTIMYECDRNGICCMSA